MHKKAITIKDIANELNLSPSTVSRALSDNPLVKTATREAVKSLAEKYNYQPNFTALSLRKNKTQTIGVIIPQIVHEFFGLVIRGIEDFCYSNGYSVIICSSHEHYEREVIDSKTLLTGRVDGLLACLSQTTEKYNHFLEFVERNIPLVFFDRVCDEIDTHKVVIDDLHAGKVATLHLIDAGAKNIAFVGGPPNLQINKDRYQGYAIALKERGLKLNHSFVVHCDLDDFTRSKFLTKELVQSRLVDGFFATTDMLAIGVMKNIKEAGLSVPNDIVIVGFSNWSISTLYEPSISTVNQPGYEMGFKAAELLIDQIQNPENKNFKKEVLKTELIKRQSSSR